MQLEDIQKGVTFWMLSTLLDFSENTGPLEVYTNIYVCICISLLLLFAKNVYLVRLKCM